MSDAPPPTICPCCSPVEQQRCSTLQGMRRRYVYCALCKASGQARARKRKLRREAYARNRQRRHEVAMGRAVPIAERWIKTCDREGAFKAAAKQRVPRRAIERVMWDLAVALWGGAPR